MKIALIAMWQLEKDLGGKRFVFDVPSGAVLADLLRIFGDEFAGRMPEALWNRAACRFRGPVVMMNDGAVLRDPAEVLHDGQEIQVFKVLVGG